MKFKKGQIGVWILSLIILSTGCSASSKSNRYETATSETKSESQVADTAIEEAELSEGNPVIDTNMAYNRKMIKTGEMEIQTKEFKACVEALGKKIQSLEGYIQNSNVEGGNYYEEYQNMRSAYLEVRIPQKHFDSFLNSPQEYGSVTRTSTNSEDITNQYVDTEIRLKSLKTRHERLLSLLEQSGSLEELFEIEKELGEVTYELEKAEGTLQKYDQLVDMSTINIHIQEVQKVQEVKPVITFGDRLVKTFNRSVENVIDLAKNFILAVVACIPFLVVFVPFVAVIAFFTIRLNRHTKNKVLKKNKKEEVLPEKQEK
ncbi:hypothetical protein CS063_07825 [Sporanaerobium hydrogeniformans]|uniref:Uncharacterized protein n=1 Tax=Sporanaerobium hydrogeniformans TaxID=3072179 RepID=A0AC61DCK7_9FIRM|nr:DUF4349 domain-containing protein [Sporanaerobium hydrogeniformans]PHV70921.1 hypothetical protein CS063_07825 [Sporanaerobium hydrogeniformans]